ncbi:MAG: hypothetical protein KF690_11380 [Bacteroidetes bacterium]|nr:hypothetical protein [Bacteroidota bacterium]
MLNTLKSYLNKRLELAGLQAQVLASVLLALLGHLLLEAFIVLIGLFLLGIALGFALGQWLDNTALGFLLAGACFLLLSLIVYFCRNPLRRYLQQHLDQLLTETLNARHEPEISDPDAHE